MNTDTIQDIIRDAHSLAKAENVTADIVRAGAETIARRLERLVAHGLYITPKKAVDAVLGNPPLNEDTMEDICPTLNQFLNPGLKVDVPPAAEPVSPDAPEMERGGSNARPGSERRSWLELPRNITLRRFVGADRSVTLVGQYRSTDPGELGASDSRPLRVYMIRLEHHADTAWNATVTENDMIIFEIQSSCGGRSMAEHIAVKALKSWLNYLSHRRGKDSKKRHLKALRQRKRAARRAARMAEAAKKEVE